MSQRDNRFRLAVEIGLIVVLTEGVIRRAFPQIGLQMLAFKFAYFPVLYLMIPSLTLGRIVGRTPRSLLFFLAWGVVVTLISMFTSPVRGGIGLLINLSFVPLLAVGSVLYGDRRSLFRLGRLMGIYCGVLGALAIYQSTLSGTHWMNRMTNQELAVSTSYGVRVPGTFQFPTVFGNFVGLGFVFCCLWFFGTSSKRQKVLSLLCGLALYVGGLGSGSRIGGIGAILVLLAMLWASATARRPWAKVLVLLVALTVIVWQLDPNRWSTTELVDQERGWRTRDLGHRIGEQYLGANLQQAWDLAGFFGAGWGTLTIGADRYAALLGEDRALSPVEKAEGGYPHILAETGLPGAILFLAFLLSLYPVRDSGNDGDRRFLTAGLFTWFFLGNFPVSIQEISVLAIPWWLLLGASLQVFPSSTRVMRRGRGPGTASGISIIESPPCEGTGSADED